MIRQHISHILQRCGIALCLAVMLVTNSASIVGARGYDDVPEATKRTMGIYFISGSSSGPNGNCTSIGAGVTAPPIVGDPTTPATPVTTGSVSLPPETLKLIQGFNFDKKVATNKERYLYAEQQTKVPWYVVATLHWREASLSSNYSVFNGQKLGTGINVDGMFIPADANSDAVAATKLFISNAKGVYGVDVTKGNLSLEEWGKAFLAYNRGGLYKNHGKTYLDSPYVMNGYDAQHMNMHWVGGAADPGSSTRGGGLDGDPVGALAAMTYLGKISLGASVCTPGIASGDFVYYSQADPKWSQKAYGGSTIYASGCGPSSVAEIVATLVDKTVTPETIASKYGRFNQGGSLPALFTTAPKAYGLKVEQLGAPASRQTEVTATLKAGGYVITSGLGSDPFTGSGHVIAIRGVGPKGGFLLGNPWPPKQFWGATLNKPSDTVKANDAFYNKEYSWSELVNAGIHNYVYLITK